MQTTRDIDSKRIDVLDGWRAVSVGLVIFSHLFLQSHIVNADRANAIADKVVLPLVEGIGYVGVNVFFVISGFVIGRGFIAEYDKYHRISLSAFYVRRAYRVMPALIIYVSVILALSLVNLVDEEAQTIVRALTFTCNIPLGSCGGWLGGHTWSLSVEEQFYLVIPVIFAAFVRSRVTLLGVAVTVPVAVFVLVILGHSEIANFVSNFCGIALGIICALYESWIRNLTAARSSWIFYCFLLTIPALARLHNTRMWAIATLALTIVITYLLFSSMSDVSVVARWLKARWMLATGRVSYGLYLWQQLATAPTGGSVGLYVLNLFVCILVVFGLFFWIELPLIRTGAFISQRIQSSP